MARTLDRGNHWTLASNLRRNDNIVEVYDSIYSSVNAKTRTLIKQLFQPSPSKSPQIQLVKTQKKVGSHDCGLILIAMATAILNGQDPRTVRFLQSRMRDHLIESFEHLQLVPFPTEI